MKAKGLVIILIGFLTLILFSCGHEGDDNLTKQLSWKETVTKMSVELRCNRIFSCEGQENYKEKYYNETACISKRTSEYQEDINRNPCEGYSGEKAYKCISCMEDLSCNDYFDKGEARCPCADICGN